jgi:hypothetical protein
VYQNILTSLIISTLKKLFLLIAISSLILGCSDEDESNPIITGEIVGQWKMIYTHARAWDSHISDVSAKNIVYNFKSNGILLVSGDQIGRHTNDQHKYSFGEETLTIGGQNYERMIVRIGNQKWSSSFSDGQMSLMELDSDGGSLTFVKK